VKDLPLALLLLAACAGKSRPPDTCSAPLPPKGSPLQSDLEPLVFYLGDWSCVGHDPKFGDWKADVHARSIAEGHLVSVSMIGPEANLTAEIKGRNQQSGQWFHVWVDRDGARGSFTAEHWDGDSLTSIDDVDPRHRTIFTKLSDTKYTHRDERDVGSGWELQWEKTCEKHPGS
jgi:hypothetical protein